MPCQSRNPVVLSSSSMYRIGPKLVKYRTVSSGKLMTPMRETCGATTRAGGKCNCKPVPGSFRCYLHGGKGGRPRGTPEHPNSRAARLEGRRRWLERMKAAKAARLIEKIPVGRKPGVRGRIRSPDPRSARLERAAEKTIDAMRAPKKPLWESASELKPGQRPELPARSVPRVSGHARGRLSSPRLDARRRLRHDAPGADDRCRSTACRTEASSVPAVSSRRCEVSGMSIGSMG